MSMNSAKTVRRLAALLLTLAMMLGSVATAYADTQAYTNKKTTIYVEDSGKLTKAGTAAKGTEVTVKDTNGGWAQVEKDGKTAYVKLSALTVKSESGSKDGDTVKCNKTIYAATEGVKVYESDDIESEEITTLSLGAKQNMVAYNDVWCMVKNGKYYGYVLREQMSLEKVSVATAEPTKAADEGAEKVTKCNKTVYVANDGAKVYADDDTSSTVQDTLYVGQKLKMTAYTDTWCLVKSGSKSGYVLRSDLSLKKVATATAEPTEEVKEESEKVTKCSKTVYVANDGAKVYADDDTSSTVQDTLHVGQKLTMTAYTDTWCLVKSGSKSGYVLRSDLSLKKVATATAEPTEEAKEESEKVTTCKKTVYVAKDGAKVYKSASESASVQDTLKLGQKLTMTAYTDTWCLVKSGSKSGYMLRSDLSLEKVEVVATPTPTPIATPAPTATVEPSGVTKCDKTGYAVKDGVKVYEKASTGSTVLTTLSKNTAVNVTGYTEKWCQVKNGSNTGYVLQDDLSDSKAVELPSELKYGDSGDEVKLLQQRLKDLGYFGGNVAGNYLAQTRTAVLNFQSQNGLDADGTAGEKTLSLLFSDKAQKYDASKTPTVDTSESTSASSNASGESTATPASGKSKDMDWWTSDIQSIFSRGTTAVVTDVATGISWKERRSGGTNHADVQPVTAADTAAMKKACGSWSWQRRAIWVSINGQKYAASMNCMPHGSGSITGNNFDGHHCIHFTNSRTHGSNKVCPLHQAAIKKALAAG